MIAELPDDDGAVKATVMLALPVVAVPMVGAPGGVGVGATKDRDRLPTPLP